MMTVSREKPYTPRDIYELWHEYAKNRQTVELLALYADDAVFESPLVPAILADKVDGVLQGKAQIARFLEEGTKRRPNALVRWYRTGEFFMNEDTVVWEYPRQTPEGDQVDILEFIKLHNGLIQQHRIYWGWKGCNLISRTLAQKIVQSETP